MLEFSPQGVHHFFQSYGNIGIFFLLAVGILGLPVPDETLIIITGFLLAQSHMPMIETMIAVYAGSMCGITLSYILGLYIGKPVLLRFGKKVGITREKFEKTHAWCERRGKWSLILGYYIPGVRHLIGIVAGTTDMSYRNFSLFAYTGVLIWGSTFLSIGYFFFDEWKQLATWIGL